MTAEHKQPSKPIWTGLARFGKTPADPDLLGVWNLLWDVVEAAEWRYGNNPMEYHRGNQKLDDALSRLRDAVDPS